jgi:hypothetical protein
MPEHEADVAQVREYVKSVDGFKSIQIVERDVNFGLARSIIEGVTSVCNAKGRVIVLEDDLIVAPGFLSYMNAALRQYEWDERVYQISGYMYPVEVAPAKDAFFLPMISCWGWATWKRAWDQLDTSLSGLSRLEVDKELRNRFDLNGAYDYFEMAQQQRKGKINSWGIQWHLSVFSKDGLVLYPRYSYVRNDGTDSSGTHGAGHSELQRSLSFNTERGVHTEFPVHVAPDLRTLKAIEHLLRGMQPGFIKRLITWIRK